MNFTDLIPNIVKGMEIYVAPIEESACGDVCIPLVIVEGERFQDVILTFQEGRLLNCSSKELLNFINQFPGDKDIIAEFGLGLNENVRELTGCALIDEKCKGTAHIAIGMNNMFGGKNSSPLHMDFIFTPEKIEADGKIILVEIIKTWLRS